ncbi:MAG TPA: hypothetical protein VKD66_05575 [Streptosporangiaceae bacterium]|nr:hypothetical protein [Streptosporangiaceae bacterium]
MEFLTDDPMAQAVTYQGVTFGVRDATLWPLRLCSCWAGELDLVVRLAGLRLRERYQDRDRGPFTGGGRDRIWVGAVTAAPGG